MARNNKLTVNVSQREKEIILTNANALNYTISAYLRTLGLARVYSSTEVLPVLPIIQLNEKKKRRSKTIK